MTTLQLEHRIVWVSAIFALTLFGLAALAIKLFHVGLPTCLTDIKPFEKGELIMHSPEHFEIHYVARMWRFEPADIEIPAGSIVDIYLSTPDVTHGLILLGTNLNLMAVPGVVNYARVRLDKAGDYQLLCHEFCGSGHDRMATNLRVVDRATFTPKQIAPTPQTTDPGYRLLEAKECMACHSVDGTEGIGPTLKGLFGRTQKLTNGQTITVDEAYLRDAIVDPSAKIPEGYEDLMTKTELTEDELNQMIEYLKTLK
jgi:cytochrome c oxidase subunit 2